MLLHRDSLTVTGVAVDAAGGAVEIGVFASRSYTKWSHC